MIDECDEDHGHRPICSHNASERGVIAKMNDLEQRLTGTISPEEIYRIMFQMGARGAHSVGVAGNVLSRTYSR